MTAEEVKHIVKDNYPCLNSESKQAKNNRGNRCWECMPCFYWNLIISFNQRTIDALVRCTRLSLDSIKRRMQASSKYKGDTAADLKTALFKVRVKKIRMKKKRGRIERKEGKMEGLNGRTKE